jgi:hypothetical protein
MAYYTELRSPYTFGPVPSPTYKSKEDGYPGGSEYLQRMNQPEINAMLQYMDAQELNDPSAVLRRKLKTPPTPSLEEDPITVLRRNTDRARNYPRESSEMFSPSFNPEGDIINFRRMNTDRARNYQRDSDYLPGKQTPPSMGPPPSTGNVLLPARTQTSAAQPESAPAQGLLDTEDTPESGTSWYDDPMRMGLLQAGLGLLSAPQYSTNPNDVTLGSALAKGLGGFVQGYGTTKKRLSEAERQKLEDDYKRSQIEFDKLYKTALTNEAIGRTEQMKNLLAKPAKDQEEWEAKVREIYPNPDNKTGQALIAAGPVEGAKKLAKLAGGMTETERTGLVSKIKNDTVLSADDKTMLLEMVSERDYEGKLSNSTAAITQVINQIKDDLKPKTETKPTEGQKLRDDLERVFIYDPTTGERKIDHVYRNSPEYRKGIDQHLDSLQSSVSVGGVGTFEKPRYPLPDGIDWGVDLATPGRKVTDLGSFVQVEGLGDNQEKINSSFATLNKLQKLQNKLVEYGKPELAERLTKKDPKVRELVSDYYDLLLTLKEEYNLGVLTGNDEQIIKSVIADPTSVDLSNFFSGLDTFVASLNSVKKSVIDNLRPVASQYNIDIMDQYNAIPGYRPLTFDPISVVPPDNDSAGYNSEAKSILQEIQTDVGPQEDPNMWNPLNWFNNN